MTPFRIEMRTIADELALRAGLDDLRGEGWEGNLRVYLDGARRYPDPWQPATRRPAWRDDPPD